MRRYFFAVITMFLLVASCGHNGQPVNTEQQADDVQMMQDSVAAAVDSLEAEIEELPMPKAADELFDDFIFNFAANRKLQLERVLFPLMSVNGNHVDTISRAQWKMDYFFMRQHYYTLLFDDEQHMEVVKDTAVSHAVVEKIYFNTKSIIQYSFYRLRGAWMLTRINTIPISSSNNASFLEFYHSFAVDADFQSQHLDATVAFIGPDPDDDFAQMEGVITPDTWEAFAPELPDRMIYNIIYGHTSKDSDTKVFVLRGIANGMELQMTFRRTADSWKLTKLNT